MNKEDLIAEVANVTGSRKKAQAVLECMLNNITSALKRKEDVKLPGFGSFKASFRKARTGMNPQTGESITIDERYIPKFSPSKTLKMIIEGDE